MLLGWRNIIILHTFDNIYLKKYYYFYKVGLSNTKCPPCIRLTKPKTSTKLFRSKCNEIGYEVPHAFDCLHSKPNAEHNNNIDWKASHIIMQLIAPKSDRTYIGAVPRHRTAYSSWPCLRFQRCWCLSCRAGHQLTPDRDLHRWSTGKIEKRRFRTSCRFYFGKGFWQHGAVLIAIPDEHILIGTRSRINFVPGRGLQWRAACAPVGGRRSIWHYSVTSWTQWTSS